MNVGPDKQVLLMWRQSMSVVSGVQTRTDDFVVRELQVDDHTDQESTCQLFFIGKTNLSVQLDYGLTFGNLGSWIPTVRTQST